MKSLTVLLLTFIATASFATSVRPPTVLKATKIEVSRKRCPPGKMCAAVLRSTVKATYKALGCLDEVEVTSSESDLEVLYVNLLAVNHHNSASKAAFCKKMPETVYEFEVNAAPGTFVIEEATELP